MKYDPRKQEERKAHKRIASLRKQGDEKATREAMRKAEQIARENKRDANK